MMPIPRLLVRAIHGAESRLRSSEIELSHTTAMHTGSKDVVEASSAVQQVPTGTRSFVVFLRNGS